MLRLEASTAAAYANPELSRSIRNAEQNITSCDECLAVSPDKVRILMIRAANERVLHRESTAVETYRQALQYDRRPELFLQLGLTEAELGHMDAAEHAISAAVRFNPRYLDSVDNGWLRQRISNQLQADYMQIGNLLFSGSFNGAEQKQGFSGTGMGPNIDDHWRIYNASNGLTTTRRVSGPDGRDSLLVVARAAYCGILQDWASADTGPSRVVTEAKILVKSGRVMLGSGPIGRSLPDSVVTASDGWQRVSAHNRSCPANRTVIFSYDGPAEFYVADIVVRAVNGAPCDDLVNSPP